jgi:2-oxoisovalerate dehydrogenase E1 component
VFLVEDNGYAISVPVEFQTPGGDISRLVRSFPGLYVDSIDGTDFPASLRAMRTATAHVRAGNGPAFVHARVIRPYSHSLSDDERLYKTPAEREAEARRDPLGRLSGLLRTHGLATDRDFAMMLENVEQEINDAALEALQAPQPARDTARSGVFTDVDRLAAFNAGPA